MTWAMKMTEHLLKAVELEEKVLGQLTRTTDCHDLNLVVLLVKLLEKKMVASWIIEKLMAVAKYLD